MDLSIVFGLVIVPNLSAIGKRKTIPGDGNCGYTGLQVGLSHLGIDSVQKSLPYYRKELYDYIVKRREQHPPLSDIIVSL